ncbi:OTU domain-containing protein 3 [Trichoplax sp. H2]|nr:OTU domain-containing protein 3 [Trichoplax sp. H2]|eukprot:RDD39250.1 OTU domain-containing protein 3 [Trichoplax sp. H2]
MGKKQNSNGQKSQRLAQQQRKRDERAARREIRRQKEQTQSSSEENSLKLQLSRIQLKIRQITGDGNCLFRALADQLEGHESNHINYRQQVVQYMIQNRNDFEPFMIDNVSFDKHIQLLGQEGTFAGNDALVAFARIHRLTIVIHQLNKPCWQIEGIDGPTKTGSRELHISYHDFEHYSSVRKIKDNHPHGAADVKLNQLKSDSDKIACNESTKKKQKGIQDATEGKCHNNTEPRSQDASHPDSIPHSHPTPAQDTTSTTSIGASPTHSETCINKNEMTTTVTASALNKNADATNSMGNTFIHQPNEIELEVMHLSNCTDINLVREALREHEYNISNTVAYIVQIEELTSQDGQSTQKTAGHHLHHTVAENENKVALDNHSNGKLQQSSSKGSKGNIKGRPSSHQQPNKYISNRRRKELAKKDRQKRRDERKKNNNETIQSTQQNQTPDLPSTLQLLHI